MTLNRVGVIAYHASPLAEPGTGDAGGMTVYIRAVARALAARGVSTDIFTRSSRPAKAQELSPGVRVIGIGAGPRRPVAKETAPAHLAEFVAGVRAYRAAHRLDYDVIHSHYWQSGVAAVHLCAGSTLHVHSSHTLSLVKARSRPGGREPGFDARLRAEVQVVSAADALVASTLDEVNALSSLYGAPPGKVACVAPGVDHSVFHPGDRYAARAALGVGREALVLYVGRIQPLKGIDLALAAASEVSNAVERDVVMLVVGGPSGPQGDAELARLQRLTGSLGLKGRVRFVGPQPHDRLPVYYRAADVVVVPSHSESFGLAALEAHACGTPVVSTAVGAAADVIAHGESGFVLDERDPSSMAGYMKTILSDRDDFGAKSLEQARDFAWESTAEALQVLYSRLVRDSLREACTS